MFLKPLRDIRKNSVFGHVELPVYLDVSHIILSMPFLAYGMKRTPGDMIMPGPRCDAGNSQLRRVRPSRVLKSKSSRGAVIVLSNCGLQMVGQQREGASTKINKRDQ